MGNGIGGDVGVWLAADLSKEVAGGTLAFAMSAKQLRFYLASNARIVTTETLGTHQVKSAAFPVIRRD